VAKTRYSIVERLARRLGGLGAKPRHRDIAEDRLRDYGWALLNIKTLGYELARQLTNDRFAPVPGARQHVGLTSKLCTQADMESAWVSFWCAECGVAPVYHRKVWEFCYAAQALSDAGMLMPGRSGIGFGCGGEPLPSLCAKYGCEILATDLPITEERARKWAAPYRQATPLEAVRMPHICPDPRLLDHIRFQPVDMIRIPKEFDGQFDFCWSCCALEHLGSIAAGSDYIERSLQVLKPNGVAVHTTEFNLDDSGDTLDAGDPVLFQRRHMEGIAERLASQGHHVAELDFTVGDGVLDRFVDLPPFDLDVHRRALPPFHLTASVWGFRCTSFGLIVRRGG
jgi:SAM-dependent methyltransferase